MKKYVAGWCSGEHAGFIPQCRGFESLLRNFQGIKVQDAEVIRMSNLMAMLLKMQSSVQIAKVTSEIVSWYRKNHIKLSKHR